MNNNEFDHSETADTLLLGHELWSVRPTLHNGPGWRIPLWVQGCSLRCTTVCLNPHFLSNEGGFRCRIDEIVAHISALVSEASEDVEGMTVLGGEPTDQAAAVAALFRAIKGLGLSTMLYSGATFEQLRSRRSAAIDELLANSDLLVDGPFLPHEFDKSLVWRGSRNQRILCLNGRYSDDDIARSIARQGRSYSMVLLPDGRISVSGLQTRKGAQALERTLGRP
jgi:anaerobic ribonucleoside-triphosphate reductase activating protein